MKRLKEFLFGTTKTDIKRIVIIIIYILATIVFNIRTNIMVDKFKEFADESEHIAYIAYLEKTNEIVPQFENMKTLDNLPINDENGIITTKFNRTKVNNLGHPPVYYQIMRIFGMVQVENDEITYNLDGLRMVSRCITIIALMVAFYIGYTQLKSVFLNAIYSLFIVLIPLMSYVGGAVQNDVLSFLGINLFVLAALRFFENKRNYGTYILIAVSIAICLLNKLTVGLILCVAIIVILLYVIIKEKNFNIVFCKEFVVTLPIYVIIAAYYGILISRYGTINPSLAVIAPEYYIESGFYVPEIGRKNYSFLRYTRYFWKEFFLYWAGPIVNGYLIKKTIIASIPAIIALIGFPILNFFFKDKKEKKTIIVEYSLFIGLAVAIIIQFLKAYYEFKNVSGYLGAYHSRYYVCMAVPLAIIFCNLINKIFEKIENKKIQKDKNFVEIMFIILIIEFFVLLAALG